MLSLSSYASSFLFFFFFACINEKCRMKLKHSLIRWSLQDENRSNFYDLALMNKVQL